MRVLMLQVCFGGLGAQVVTSAAFADCRASQAVLLRLRYEHDGEQRVVRGGVAAAQHRYRMSRERWDRLAEQHAALLGAPAELEGVGALRTAITPPGR